MAWLRGGFCLTVPWIRAERGPGAAPSPGTVVGRALIPRLPSASQAIVPAWQMPVAYYLDVTCSANKAQDRRRPTAPVSVGGARFLSAWRCFRSYAQMV